MNATTIEENCKQEQQKALLVVETCKSPGYKILKEVFQEECNNIVRKILDTKTNDFNELRRLQERHAAYKEVLEAETRFTNIANSYQRELEDINLDAQLARSINSD